ncbi:amino acid adenylation domain-containing protein [Agrobacterium cavarae]|uniref:Amino acid adenylation domain-containing protein n=1 Tax=Agrobacterium cavarae TaxID=2528239 RepID=A0ABY1Y8W8_9HYPH|nr:non-ribosomal peptide synthetase [Agrobacterium cavarae]TBN12308.1 amino acid adenylation domain-containing protein [Agrobacterium cavarae]
MNSRVELLRRRLDQTGVARSGVQKRQKGDIAPLSDAQHRMWLHQKLHPASGAYNVCIRIDLSGALDESRLIDALAAVVDRHEVLRTTYSTGEDGEPYQQIHAHLRPAIEIVEHVEPVRVARETAGAPFDIGSSSPLRAHLVKVSATEWSLIMTVHHIVWDGGCFGNFSRDLSLAYRGSELEPLPVQYADLATHLKSPDARSAANLDTQMDYWRQVLTPPPPALPLPTIYGRGPRISEQATRLDRVMPTACATGLRTVAATLRTTPFAVFIAAYALLLYRWTGVSDITIGTMVANRHQPGSRDLIGNFGNTVLLRIYISAEASFRELLAQTAQIVTDAVSNGDVSFERLVSELSPPREAGHGFFTDTLGLFLDRDIEGPALPDVDVRWTNIFNGSSPFALTFQGFLTGDVLQVEATFRTELFAPKTVLEMLEHLESILSQGTASPERSCALVSDLPTQQRDRLMQLSCGAEVEDQRTSVIEHWRHHVKVKPSDIALVHATDRYRFAEIDEHANRLAAHLLQRGIRQQDVVAVAAGRGLITVVAPLAIWKCGAIYLPLDPNHPQSRLQRLIQTAGAKLVICDRELAGGDAFVISVASVLQAPHDQPTDTGYNPHPLEAAHIGFTSGSTGQPKGVVTTHASLTARTSWVCEHWPGGSGGARLAKSAPTAIDATAELCEAFVTGEYIVLATDDEARDAAAIGRLLTTHGIGHLMAVPGLVEAVTIASPDIVSDRDRVLSTGEPLLAGVAASIYRAAENVQLHNSYGCTETTGDVTAGRVSRRDAESGSISIGQPLPGSRCYVLSADLTLSPPGALGELYVEGQQLARGYLAQPALTSARFVANPFNRGGRLYRTGDLVRWREEGRLELVGRIDDQVNIRGHRVEPDETIAELYSLPDVKEAIVLPRSVDSTTELVAYVSGNGLEIPDGPKLRAQLADRLPGPLVPSEIIVLPSLPRLVGGKIDRQALPKTVAVIAETPSRAPRNEREERLAGLLSELLGGKPLGIDDNFFALGGDSLTAVSFAARANAAGFNFPAAAVFQYPTVAQLVEQLPPPIEEKPKSVILPPQLHRLRLSGASISEFLTWQPIRNSTNPEQLRRALADVIARYETFQQAITVRGRLWRATRLPAPARAANVIELQKSDPGEILAAAQSAIDIAKGDVIAAIVTPRDALLIAHAAVVDGLSLARIATEIEDGKMTEVFRLIEGTSTVAAHDWQSVLDAGPKSPWWVGPDEHLSEETKVTVRGTIAASGKTPITYALLRAARDIAKSDLVVADVEVEPVEVSPLLAVPVLAQVGISEVIGTARSYLDYLARHRPVAGGPGLLVRRTVTPQALNGVVALRGTDRLYRIVASWQAFDDRTELEIAAGNAAIAQELLNAWIAAIQAGDAVDA